MSMWNSYFGLVGDHVLPLPPNSNIFVKYLYSLHIILSPKLNINNNSSYTNCQMWWCMIFTLNVSPAVSNNVQIVNRIVRNYLVDINFWTETCVMSVPDKYTNQSENGHHWDANACRSCLGMTQRACAWAAQRCAYIDIGNSVVWYRREARR